MKQEYFWKKDKVTLRALKESDSEILTYATTWMNPEDIMLNERISHKRINTVRVH